MIKYVKKLPTLFQYKYIPKLYCQIQFFSAKEPAGILGKLSSFSASYLIFLVLVLVLFIGHLVFYEDRNQTFEVS